MVCWPPSGSNTNQYSNVLGRANFNPTEKRANHEAKSLETLVENLVKNWEIEASHKMDVSEWRTVDPKKYTFAINGGPPQDAEHMLKVCVAPSLALGPRLSQDVCATINLRAIMTPGEKKEGKGQGRKFDAVFASSSLTKKWLTKAIPVVLIPRS